ncbi:trigger factor [Propionivibrio dicarboxylicus]|uniref:Trigger factor n=1 Tax=Propionivibrio dicarboxylicus TaxID=83767 RepID=A0A1G8C6R1_9RHOO|nr:trigger factor [Propionivibrio dicarboxylicus]SDH41095.1 trigger factor [Propionivibrio dicarboxylicus]
MDTNATQSSTETAQQPSALERRLDLSVVIADLDKDVEARLRKIGKTVKMPGFRPGKVPAAIIKQQYGHEAQSEAIGEALEKAFGEAVRSQKLRVAGQPRIEPKTGESTTHMEFTAIFEVFPEITLGDLSSVEIKRSTLEVGDAELDNTIAVLRKQRTQYEPVDRVAAKGDRVTIDFLGKKGGEPFAGGQATDYPFVIGEGAMLADFEAAVTGLKAGESKTFEMTFPADYVKDLAGQTVSFEITVKEVREPILPEVDGEFAKSLGIGNGDVAAMRAEIETNLKREVSKRLQNKVKDQVMDALLQVNPIEVPKALVDMEIQQLMQQAREDMAQRGGAKMKDFPMQPEWFADQAKRRVSLGLILSEIVKEKELQPKPEQIKAIVEDAAQSYEHPEEVVRWYYAHPQRLSEIEGVAIEENVVNWALSAAKVVDEAIAFDDLMGRQG